MGYFFNDNINIKNYARGKFAVNVATLMTGTIIAQAIQLGISPILTRIYSPSEFGMFALYMSVVSLFSVVATGRYEMAIMLPAGDDDALNIMALSGLITVAVSGLSLLAVVLAKNRIALALGDIKLAPWLYLVPCSIILTGAYQIFNYWSNRNKQYKRLSASRVFQYGSSSLANIGMGLGGWGVGGLIGGGVLGQSVATGILGYQTWRDKNRIPGVISWKKIKSNARRYKDFPLINSLHAFMDMLQLSGTNFLITFYFGSVTLGLYTLTVRILRAPLTLMGASLSQVFLQKAAETYNSGQDLQKLVGKTIAGLVLAALPIFILIYIFSPVLFSMVFGGRWQAAGEYARILSPWLFLNFIVSPLSQIPIIVNKQKEVLYLGLFGNLLLVMSILYGAVVAHSIQAGLYMLSATQLAYLSGALVWLYKISGKRSEAYA